MAGKIKDLGLSLFILIVGIVVLYETRDIPYGAVERGAGFIASPRFYVGLVATVLAVLAVMLLIKTIKKAKESNFEEEPQKFMTKEILMTMVSLLIYVFFIEILGFILSSFLWLSFIIVIYHMKLKGIMIKERVKFLKTIGTSLVISLVTMLVLQQLFVRGLGVRFPTGIFGW